MQRFLGVALLVVLWSDCGPAYTPPASFRTSSVSSTSPSLPTTATAADLRFCVDKTNRLRAQTGRAALTESAALEAYAAEGARIDFLANVWHQRFDSTNGGGLARAKNEALAWPLDVSRTVTTTIQQAIAAFYAEGPGGDHYQNLTGPYTQLGCGVYISGSLITVIQDFR
jgi:uncharacterized protein YkwD